MAKKIYDILPPKLANKKKSAVAKQAVVGKVDMERKPKRPSAVAERARQKRGVETIIPPSIVRGKRRAPLREIMAGSAVILLLLSIYLYNKLPKADIQIWPVMEQFSLQEKITADKTVLALDVSRKVIPAQYMEEAQDGWQEFLATGDVNTDKKATGTIKIYNKLNPAAAFTLIKGTHFLSDSGKYFVILEKVVIPAAQYQKGKLVAGSVSVKVEAEQAGEGSNIGPSKFSIPKLSGTAYYYSIYAESTATMIGGHQGSAKRVTKDDIDKAKEDLSKKLLSQAETTLRGKLSEQDVVIDNSLQKTVIDFTTTAKADTIIEKFTANATVKVSALIFKKPDLEQFAKGSIGLKLSEAETFLEKSLEVSYSPASVDSKKGSALMDLKISVPAYKSMDENALVNLFSQKTSDEIKSIISENYGSDVSKVEVDFWPFWVKSAPKNKNRINIDLMFE